MKNPLLIIKIAMFSAIPLIIAIMYAVTGDSVITTIVVVTMAVGDVIALRFIEKSLRANIDVVAQADLDKDPQSPQSEQL